MTRNTIIAVLVALLALPLPSASFATTTGQSCQGDACQDVSFIFSGGCYRITNHGSRRVWVSMGNISFGLERGEARLLTNPFAPNICLTAFRGGVSAVYP